MKASRSARTFRASPTTGADPEKSRRTDSLPPDFPSKFRSCPTLRVSFRLKKTPPHWQFPRPDLRFHHADKISLCCMIISGMPGKPTTDGPFKMISTRGLHCQDRKSFARRRFPNPFLCGIFTAKVIRCVLLVTTSPRNFHIQRHPTRAFLTDF